MSVHFLSMNSLLFFTWSNTQFVRCSFVRWCWNFLAKITSYFWLLVFICIWGSNMFDPGSLTVDINWYIALINSIDSIYNLFDMPRCTYASINYNGVTLRHNIVQHKHHCFTIFYSMMFSIFFVFEQWNQMLDVCISSGIILFAIIR